MTAKPSGRTRHSFVQFYMADWLAGTARMSRVVRSIYFDVCVYNWDKAQAVPEAELYLMLSDVEHGERFIDVLVETGQLVRNEDRSVYSPRAIAEAQRAYEAWQAKSRGGRAGTPGQSKDSSNTPGRERPQNQSQSQKKKGEADASPKDGEEAKPKPKIAYDAEGMKLVADAWNAMAAKAGIAQVQKITEERRKRLNARISEHGAEKIAEAVATIPESDFLMGRGPRGWKANFDWLLQPESCAKLIEGTYHNEGEGGRNAWSNR